MSRTLPTSFATEVTVILALALAPAIGLGIGRFAYALVLPDMRTALAWNYAEAGWMNASNALGYLLGALMAAPLTGRIGAFATMFAGAVLCVVATGLCAVVEGIWWLNLARLLAGIGGAYAFVAGGLLAAQRAQRHPAHAAFLLGLFYAGAGFGILITGLGVPLVLAQAGAGSWQTAWAALTILSIPMAAGLWLGRRNSPAKAEGPSQPAPLWPMRYLLAGYVIFGAGYIAYMTFMFAWVRDSGAGVLFQGMFWGGIGAAAMVSPWLWVGIFRRLNHGRPFAVLTSITIAGTALPLFAPSLPMLLVSALLFGSAFFAVVSSTTAFVRRNLPPAAWPAGIGAFTVAFGLGQTVGPIAMGSLNDWLGGLSAGLWASTALLILAALLALLQRDLPPPPG